MSAAKSGFQRSKIDCSEVNPSVEGAGLAIFHELANDCEILGASASYWDTDHGIISVTHGVAYNNIVPAVPMQCYHRFRASCLSKVFIGHVAAKMLTARGVSLEEPIRTRFPELLQRSLPEDNTISFLHLLSHSVGLDETDLKRHFRHLSALRQLPNRLSDIPQLSPPGSQYAYSPCSALILAYVIEILGSAGWDRVVFDELLSEAGAPIDAVTGNENHKQLAGSHQNEDGQHSTARTDVDRLLFQDVVESMRIQLTPIELCRAGRLILRFLKSAPIETLMRRNGWRSFAIDNHYIAGASFGLLHYHNNCVGLCSNGVGQNNMLVIDPHKARVLAVSTNTFPETLFMVELASAVLGGPMVREESPPLFRPDTCAGVYVSEGMHVIVRSDPSSLYVEVYSISNGHATRSLGGSLKYTGRREFTFIREDGSVPLERLSFFSPDVNDHCPRFLRFSGKVCKRRAEDDTYF